MKKFLKVSFFGLLASFLFANMTFANSRCTTIDGDRVCLNITRNGSRYYIDTAADFGQELRCQLRTPETAWATIYHLPGCSDEIEYNWSIRGQMSIYMNYGNSSQTFFYDIRNDEVTLWDSVYYSNNYDEPEDGYSSSSSNGDLNMFSISPSDSTPSQDQQITLNISARDSSNYTLNNYNSTADLQVYYRTSSSSSRRQTTSSSYVSVSDRTPNFSNWTARVYVTFRTDYDYEIVVRDWSAQTTKVFYMNGNNSNTNSSDVSSFVVTSSDYDVYTNDNISLYVYPKNGYGSYVTNYRNTVNFEVYRRNTNGTYTKVSTSYYTLKSSDYDLDNGSSTYEKLSNIIYFKQSGYYRVFVYFADDRNVWWYNLTDIRVR